MARTLSFNLQSPRRSWLIGAAQLAPKWMFKAHRSYLAVDVGGTNIRAGIVELNLKKAG
jgi:hexokinase